MAYTVSICSVAPIALAIFSGEVSSAFAAKNACTFFWSVITAPAAFLPASTPGWW